MREKNMNYKELIKQMTLEEKASLMSGKNFWNTKSIERLGIPSMMLSDGPHGVRKQSKNHDHLGLNKSVPATCYPTAAGLANTWNEELLEEMGEYLGLEAASEGISVLLGPGCNIKRNPLCGRNFEYFSEDPYLSGKMAAALIRGIQKNGISACVKHFAANSQEHLRMSNDSVMDERTLREIYLPAFEIAVKEGKTKCLMTSYNKLNGTYTNENEHLLQEILKDDWGYEGMVVTDWGGNNDRVEGLIAGNHLEMPSTNGETDKDIVKAVKEGLIDEALLDERVEKVLKMVFETQNGIKNKSYDKKAHHKKARQIALETAVLLKNEDHILPLNKKQKIAVIGEFAKSPYYQGTGSSKINPTKINNAYDALKKLGANIVGYEPGFKRHGKAKKEQIQKACLLAKKADVVLVFIGLEEGYDSEGSDREDMHLPLNQRKLINALKNVNKNLVAVLSCGCVIDMSWDIHTKAVLHGYLGGQAGGAAIAQLLLGKKNPSGKIAETVPMRYEDVPSSSYYPGMEVTSEYREGIYVGYRYYDTAKVPVKYPFGHGLSYTQFEYSDLNIDGNLITFQVKNTGKRTGREVAQLYIAPRTNGMFRPEKELKGFSSVTLKPGEKKEISIELNDRSFAVWSILENDWVVEPGEYDILVGASSADIRLRQSITKDGYAVENPYKEESFKPYYKGAVKNISDETFEVLLKRKIPEAKWDLSKPLDFNDTIYQGKYSDKWMARMIYWIVFLARKGLLLLNMKETAANTMFVMNLPYRGIGRMSGILNDRNVRGLLKVINGENNPKNSDKKYKKCNKMHKNKKSP